MLSLPRILLAASRAWQLVVPSAVSRLSAACWFRGLGGLGSGFAGFAVGSGFGGLGAFGGFAAFGGFGAFAGFGAFPVGSAAGAATGGAAGFAIGNPVGNAAGFATGSARAASPPDWL